MHIQIVTALTQFDCVTQWWMPLPDGRIDYRLCPRLEPREWPSPILRLRNCRRFQAWHGDWATGRWDSVCFSLTWLLAKLRCVSLAISSLLLWASGAALAETNPPRVIVDISAPQAEIRAQLLQQTPPGSSIEYVISFISNRLQRTRSGVAKISIERAAIPSQPRVAKTIHVYLGQYYKHIGAVFLTAPMVVHEDVSALWLFDRNGRLIDILVDKHGRVY